VPGQQFYSRYGLPDRRTAKRPVVSKAPTASLLHRRSDSFRPERTRGRGEWLPLESQNLSTAHTDTNFL